MAAGAQLGDDSVLRVPDHVLTRRAAGETVLLNLDNEEYYGLSGVGDRAWRLFEEAKPFGEVVEVLVGEFEVEPSVLEADLTALIGDLVASGLVVVDGT